MINKEVKRLMLADDLTAYIYEKHTQEECIGFINGYKAALRKVEVLNKHFVVGRSEQFAYSCSKCKRGFNDYGELNKHYERIHTK